MALYNIAFKSFNNLIFHNSGLCQSKTDIILSMVLLGNNFSQFFKYPGNYTSKSHEVETKPVGKWFFLIKILVNATALKTQMIIIQSMME